MTVCIAAFAADSKAIVLVADKSVSYLEGDRTRQRFDVAFQKIRPTRVMGWAALISGPMDFGERVVQLADEIYAVQKAEAEMSDEEFVAVKGLPECIKDAFQICRQIEVVDRILTPRLLTKEWYDKKVADAVSSSDSYFLAVEDLVSGFDNQSSILLCGFENGAPQIYLITNPGVLGSESAAGLAATGIGQDTALNRLYSLETDPSDFLEKVLYDLYDAKESCSESLPDVGREWDAMVLVDGKDAIGVNDDITELIEDVFKAHPKSPFVGPVDGGAPEDARERLKVWAMAMLSR